MNSYISAKRVAARGHGRDPRRNSAAVRRGTESGATLVEYALIIGLVVLVSIGAIESVVDRGEDRLDDRRNSAGAPDVDAAAFPPPSGSGGGDGGGDGSGDGGTTAVEPHVSLASSTQKQNPPGGNKVWTATVTVLVSDPSDNTPIGGVEVSGSFDPAVPAGKTYRCTTDTAGQCQMTQAMERDNKEPDYVASVTFTVTGASGPGITYTETPPSIGPIGAPQ